MTALQIPLKLRRRVKIAKGRNTSLSSLLEARGESVFFTANEDILDHSGGHEFILRLSGRTGSEIWRVPADRFQIAWSTEAFASVVAESLLVTNEGWTAARGISIESGRVLYSLNARKLRLWRNRWLLTTDDGLVLADPATGETLETRAPLPVAPSDAGLVRIDGDVILYQAEDNTQVVAYDLSRQALLWKRPLRREIAERFRCDVGVVVLRPMEPNIFLAHVTSRIVVGCSLADGSILWDMAVPFDSPVVPHRDRVYVMLAQEGRESSPRLVCLDAATGAWVYDVLQPELNVMDFASYGTIHEDHIGFGTRGGLVGLFRLSDGGLAWSYRYTLRLWTNVWLHTPVMADERLYVCADDGNLLIFEPA
jgi:outer membrane protein assembly factor BamB